MAADVGSNNLGLKLRELLKERSLSMRKLGELTNIDAATISRIINSKRKANLQHLEQFADSLEVPLIDLVEAAGYAVIDKEKDSHLDSHTYADTIQEILASTNVVAPDFNEAVIEQQLSNYKQLAQTIEGKSEILKGFGVKLESVGSIGPLIGQIKELFRKFRLEQGRPGELAIIGAALLYFIIPVDAIPDYLFAIGYLDDAIAVQLTTNALSTN